MKVSERNVTIYAGNDERATQSNQIKQNEKANGFNGKSINAKDLRIVPDKIMEKKLNAQKKAWDIVAKANEKEKAVDDNLSEMQQKIEDLKEASQNTQKEINQINGNIGKIKEEYGVADGSQEQKDLELLMKQQEKMQGGTDVELTKEDQERLANMGELTDYQTRALAYSESLHTKKAELEQNNNQIHGTVETIDAVKIERGKSHGMVDAKVESDKLMEAASKEAANALLAEGKDAVDDKMDQVQEDADKKAEEKKAEEKKAEEENEAKAEEKKQAQEAQVNGESQNQSNSTEQSTAPVDISLATENVQRKISTILKDENLLAEDLKGIALDTNL